MIDVILGYLSYTIKLRHRCIITIHVSYCISLLQYKTSINELIV